MIVSDLNLVRSVIDKSIDDELILVGLIKSERHVEFLMFGVGNDTGCHG
jgi:hypothetical protein